jgi:hypothetical protein
LHFGLVHGGHGFSCLHYELTRNRARQLDLWSTEAGRLGNEIKIAQHLPMSVTNECHLPFLFFCVPSREGNFGVWYRILDVGFEC